MQRIQRYLGLIAVFLEISKVCAVASGDGAVDLHERHAIHRTEFSELLPAPPVHNHPNLTHNGAVPVPAPFVAEESLNVPPRTAPQTPRHAGVAVTLPRPTNFLDIPYREIYRRHDGQMEAIAMRSFLPRGGVVVPPPLAVRFARNIYTESDDLLGFEGALWLLGGPYVARHVALNGVRTDDLYALFYVDRTRRFPHAQVLELHDFRWLVTDSRAHKSRSDWVQVCLFFANLERLTIQFSAGDQAQHASAVAFLRMMMGGFDDIDNLNARSRLRQIHLVFPDDNVTSERQSLGVTAELHDDLRALVNARVFPQLEFFLITRNQNTHSHADVIVHIDRSSQTSEKNNR